MALTATSSRPPSRRTDVSTSGVSSANWPGTLGGGNGTPNCAPTATNIKPWRLITASKLASPKSISLWPKTAVLTRASALARLAATATISAAARPAPPWPAARSSTRSPSPTRVVSSSVSVARASCSSTNPALASQPGATLFQISDTAAHPSTSTSAGVLRWAPGAKNTSLLAPAKASLVLHRPDAQANRRRPLVRLVAQLSLRGCAGGQASPGAAVACIPSAGAAAVTPAPRV